MMPRAGPIRRRHELEVSLSLEYVEPDRALALIAPLRVVSGGGGCFLAPTGLSQHTFTLITEFEL